MILTFVIMSLVPMILGTILSAIFPEPARPHVFHRLFPSFMALASSLLVSIAVALALWFKILLPLGNISQAAKHVAKGDFSIQVPPCHSLQELNELTSNFNRMVQELGGIEAFQSDFVTNISHEFKTPLTAIEGYATLLQDPSLSEELRQEYLHTIIDSTKQLSAMAGSILLFSRLERQEIVTNKTTFRLDEQIRQTILLLEPLWEKKQLELDISLPSVTYHENAGLLSQVWMNLLQNAIKFTPSGGLLTITMEQLPGQLSISISDTGIGMDEETIKHIFDKFYRGKQAANESGSGLGLSITKRIIELLHGSITVKSSPNEGSCFTVTLPYAG